MNITSLVGFARRRKEARIDAHEAP